MKVAIVHDWLNTKFGGAENMVVELAKLYPDAPIYTLLYNREVCGDAIDPDRVQPSVLQRFPAFLRNRSRYLLPLIPMAVEQFDFSEFDVVISSSSAWVKGIITKPETLHVCYCHTPMRFVWDYWPAYVEEQRVGPLRRAAIHRLTSRLRLWDYYSAARVDRWVANSQTTAARIEKYYRRSADTVIFPGADLAAFKPTTKKDDYFITVSSLTPYKKIDMAIAACNRLGKRLVVVGDGADRARLERLAGPTVEFKGRVDVPLKADLVAKAQALLFPNEEDFGIVPIEAFASGTPVIAYRKGGLTETMVEGKTGMFFDEPTVESLAAAIQAFKADAFDAADLTGRAHRYSLERFGTEIKEYVEKAYHEFTQNR